MTKIEAYIDFVKRLRHLINKNPHLIKVTLGNIFTMRLIGNKTHGDMAEIGICEFVNQFMYDFRSVHIGKDLFRAKEHEEDIRIINEIHQIDFTISLKAYGDGPLQLSTDKNFKMFPHLKRWGKKTAGQPDIDKVFNDPAFREFGKINVLPLIYDEKGKRCNIMVFDFEKARKGTAKIKFKKQAMAENIPSIASMIKTMHTYARSAMAMPQQMPFKGAYGRTRRMPLSILAAWGGWIDYSDNRLLVQLFSHALVATSNGHEKALEVLKTDIQSQKENSNLRTTPS